VISIKAAVDVSKQPYVDRSWAHAGPNGPEHKFFGNFPYPYMNGMLHLGHAFSLSKVSHPDGLPHALSCSSQHIVCHTVSTSAAWSDTVALRAAAGVCLGFPQAVRQEGPVPTGLPLHRHAYQGAPQRSTQVDPQALQHQHLRVPIRTSHEQHRALDPCRFMSTAPDADATYQMFTTAIVHRARGVLMLAGVC
jgi:hypothetical protein